MNDWESAMAGDIRGYLTASQRSTNGGLLLWRQPVCYFSHPRIPEQTETRQLSAIIPAHDAISRRRLK
jgi:hypothetical protein